MFRSAKRRKFTKQLGPRARGDEDDVDSPPGDSQAAHPGPEHHASSEDSTMSSILKLRRQQRSRTGGVQFSNSRSAAMEDVAGSTALVPVENLTDNLTGIADRFVGHSGQVVDVDKHIFRNG